MKEFIQKYQKAIVGTGAISVLLICYFLLISVKLSDLKYAVSFLPVKIKCLYFSNKSKVY